MKKFIAIAAVLAFSAVAFANEHGNAPANHEEGHAKPAKMESKKKKKAKKAAAAEEHKAEGEAPAAEAHH